MSVVKIPKSTIDLPPSSIEAEEALLGGLLLEQERLDEVAGVVKPEDFFHRPNGLIYDAMVTMRTQRVPIDGITLAEALRTKGIFEQVGGTRYLGQLYERVPDPQNLARYAEIIKEKALLRALDL
ncbi:MAG TPA: DnaB-like helicase N-terminal domain-containing protein, partial [bacterium]|nr:DnaB-like helicase N-terminal domain-containing protein [bacterium]